jgi:mono/diheme cytochrome c family protein
MKAQTALAGMTLMFLGAVSRMVAQDPDGKTLYVANCKRCHGVLGTPPKAMKEQFPKIATFDAAFIAKHSNDSIVTVLTKGKGEDMKPFKGKLTPAEMVAVAKYVHELAEKPRP